MKKIINWTFGSFFRSLGRTLAILFIGAIITLILLYSGVRLPRLFPIMRVNASELQDWSVSESRILYDKSGTNTFTSWYTNMHTFTLDYPIVQLQYRVKAKDGILIKNSYKIDFYYKPTPDAIQYKSVYLKKGGDFEYMDISCTNSRFESGYYHFKCSFSPNYNISSDEYLIIGINFYSSYLTNIRVGIDGYDERLGTDSVITEQTDKINETIKQETDKIYDNITSDNIDDANNDASSFFEGFNSEDNGGLSGIITAPLNSINAMLSDSCTPMRTTWKGKEIILPCGTDFYNSLGDVRKFINMLEGGFLSYMILRKLYFLIQKLKNPEDDRVEVMSL